MLKRSILHTLTMVITIATIVGRTLLLRPPAKPSVSTGLFWLRLLAPLAVHTVLFILKLVVITLFAVGADIQALTFFVFVHTQAAGNQARDLKSNEAYDGTPDDRNDDAFDLIE